MHGARPIKGETVLDRAIAEQRLEVEINIAEILKNGWASGIQKRDQDQSARFMGIRGKGTEVCNHTVGCCNISFSCLSPIRREKFCFPSNVSNFFLYFFVRLQLSRCHVWPTFYPATP